MSDSRKAFEAWITAPPYEKSLATIAASGGWPGQYVDYAVQLAWEAWVAGRVERSTTPRDSTREGR